MTTINEMLKPPINRGHGSPYDRGSADAYYGRPPRPHKWTDGLGRAEVTDLTADEVKEYHAGYDQEEDRKDWGDDDDDCDGEFDE